MELIYENALKNANDFDLYTLARYAHKIGMDMLTDDQYDILEANIERYYPFHPLINENWEEDEEPTELAKKFGIIFPDLKKSSSERIVKYSRQLSYQHAISIRPVRDYQIAYNWFEQHCNQDLIFMLKIDGIHLTALTDNTTGEVLCVASRARKDNSQILDYTDAFTDIFNNFKYEKTNKENKYNLTHFECYCDKVALNILRNSSGIFYKTEKSAALGLMTRGVNNKTKKYVKLYALKGESRFSTHSQNLRYLNNECGFNIPPFMVSHYTSKTFNNFMGYIEEIQKYLINKANELDIPFDGIVVQINDNKKFLNEEENEKYSNGNIAIKFGFNDAKKFVAKVKAIEMVPAKEKLIPKIILEPTQSPDGKIIKEISGYNLRQLINNNIKPGNYISIKWQSDAIPVLDI